MDTNPLFAHGPSVRLWSCLGVGILVLVSILALLFDSTLRPAPSAAIEALSPTSLVRTDTRYALASIDHSSGFVPAPEGMTLADAADFLAQTNTGNLSPDFRRHSRYWLFTQVDNNTNVSDWMLHISNFGYRQPAVLVKGATGQKIIRFHNDGSPDDADINTIGRAIDLKLQAGESYWLIVELKADHATWHPYIGLMTTTEYQRWTRVMDLAYKMAIGIILGMVLLGATCWVLLREPTFFWAAGSATAMLLFYLEHSSLPALFWQWDYEKGALFWMLSAGTVFFQLAFAASFLSINRQSGFWFYAFSGTAAMTLLLGVFSSQLPLRANMILFAINYLLAVAIILCSGIAKVRSNGGYYIIYILGWLPVALSVIDVVIVTQGVHQADHLVSASYKMIGALYIQINHMLLHAVALILRVRALREQKLRAEFISESKSRFIAQSSHDLSQPLNSMKLFLEHLQPYVQEAAGEKIFRRLKQTHRQMNESFHAMMDLSQLEAGRIRPEIKPIILSELFMRLQPEYRMLANDKGIGLAIHPGSLQVMSDPMLLERMLRNLLSNAIKYTDEGRILVVCRRRKHQVAIEVFDTGCGIEEDARQHIFDIYQRSINQSEQKDGAGIGLSIVKHIADLLQIPIALDSTPGKGSRFSLLLPRVLDENTRVATLNKSEPQVLLVLSNKQLEQEMTDRLTNWKCVVQCAETLPSIQPGNPKPSILICDHQALNNSNHSPESLNYPAQGIITACICKPATPLPEQWSALSIHALPSQTRALLNAAARRKQMAHHASDGANKRSGL